MPPINSQFGLRAGCCEAGATGSAGAIPPIGPLKLTGPAGAEARGSGDPHFLHMVSVAGFSVPQLVQITVTTGAAAAISRPDSRFFPSTRSAPHWEQVTAVAGLRVPQNAQMISAPAAAACTSFASVTSFSSAVRSN